MVPRSRVFRKELIPEGANSEWRACLIKAEVAQLRMGKRLRDVPDDDPDSGWLHHCADVMKPIPVREIPVDLQCKLPTFAQEELATLEFPKRPEMPNTEWVKPPRFRKVPKHLWPRSYQEFWKPEFWPRVRLAISKLKNSLEQRVHMEEKFAFDEEYYVPELRGTPWVYTGRPDSPWMPVNVDYRPRGKILVDIIAEDMGEAFPHQQLRSFMVQGIDIGCQHMQLITLIQGNLRSFYEEGAELNMRESLLEMEDEKKYDLLEEPPSHPLWLGAQACVPKEGTTELRRVCDQGQPRNQLFTEPSKTVVKSVNEEVGLHEMQDVIDDCEKEEVDVVDAIVNNTMRGPEEKGGISKERKWAPEVKPTQKHVAQIIAVLNHLCFLMDWTLFEMISDFRRYYHQWQYAPWVEWLVSMAWSPLPERGYHSMTFVRVHVLDMGITPAWQITQFIAQYFLDKWYEVMDVITADMKFEKE